MDKITTEILERLCNGDSHMRIAREMNIPESWIDDAVMAYNAEARRPMATDMFGNPVDTNNSGMN